MSENPCNCETCSHGKKHVQILYPNGEPKTRLVNCEIAQGAITHEECDFISLVGCASHPKAREYLMEPVLKELERLRIENETNADGVVDDDAANMYGGASDAFETAITLIRNGVNGK